MIIPFDRDRRPRGERPEVHAATADGPFVVTGGAGFIGSHVVDALLRAGRSVVVVDDLSTGRIEQVDSRAKLVRMDVREEGLETLIADLRPVAVCHLAAQPSAHHAQLDPLRDADINVRGSVRLFGACVAAGVRRVVCASTAAVYGEPQRLPVDERHPTRPIGTYGASKLAMETYARAFSRRGLTRFHVLRLANVYGPRQNGAGESGVIARFATRMAAGRPCLIHGDGLQSRDFVYVEDCANLLADVAVDGATFVGPLNIGTGTRTTILELHAEIARRTGCLRPAVHDPPRAEEIRHFVCDPSRAERELSWRAATPLHDGIGHTLAALPVATSIPMAPS